MNLKSMIKMGYGASLARNIVCTLIIFAVCVASFTTVFTVDVDLNDEMTEIIETIITTEDNKDSGVKIPEKLEVSGLGLVKSGVAIGQAIPELIDSITKISDSVNSAVESGKDAANSAQNASDAYNDAVDELDPDNVEDMIGKGEIGGAFDGAGESLGDLSDSANDIQEDVDNIEQSLDDVKKEIDHIRSLITQDVLNLVILLLIIIMSITSGATLAGIVYLLVIFAMIALPIMGIVYAIITLVSLLKNLKTPERARGISKASVNMLATSAFIYFMIGFIPGAEVGSALTTVSLLCGIAIILSFVLSRIKYYEAKEFKYLNVMQIISACSVAAYMFFFVNARKSTMISQMFDVDFNNIEGDVVKMLLGILMFILIGNSFKYGARLVGRLACMGRGRSDSHIVGSIFNMLPIALAVVILTATEYASVVDNDKSFILWGLGLALIFICEIALAVFGRVLCRDMSKEEKVAVANGAYLYRPATETEETVTEEAVAEEAVAEEAPAEEAVAEEAPTEEAVAEEAPAEETVADEVAEEIAEAVEDGTVEEIVEEVAEAVVEAIDEKNE